MTMDMFRKGNLNLIKLTRIIFLVVGAVLTVTGIVLWYALRNTAMNLRWLPSVILCGIGVIFLAVGGVLALRERWKRDLETELRTRGQAIQAQVTGVSLNYSVSINGRHPYRVEASYKDPATGTVHVFRSHNLNFDPTEYVKDRTVTVYCDGNDFARSFMDIDAIFPNMEVH